MLWKIENSGHYCVVSKLDSQSPGFLKSLLISTMGIETLQIYNGCDPTDADTADNILKKLDVHIHVLGETSETFERYRFNTRSQKSDESIDDYIASLKILAKTCNFCVCLKDTLIRDRIVLGVQDDHIRKRLLQEGKLTLQRAMEICRSYEQTTNQLKVISGKEEGEVHRLTTNQHRATKSTSTYKGNSTRPYKQCKFCGRQHELKKELCPAWGNKTLNERTLGHYDKDKDSCVTRPFRKRSTSFRVGPHESVYAFVFSGSTEEDHNVKLNNMLKACSKNNIKLNKEKGVFRTDQVEFLGHLVTSQGLKPDPKKIEAILNMENPTDVEGIRRLIGTVTYLPKFLPRLSAVAEPIRRLTRQDTDWAWTDEQDKAMKEIKKLLTEAPILVYYDPSKEMAREQTRTPCTGNNMYYCFRDEITLADGLIFKGERVVVPESMRKPLKNHLHMSHLGGDSMLHRA
ncbi:hypothetical protein QZH41_011229, partial [Actinostola sp. cb2023]